MYFVSGATTKFDAAKFILYHAPHMKEGLEGFKQIRREAELFYQTIGAVRCPYFGEQILFDVSGWEHLLQRNSGQPRNQMDQLRRIKLITHAILILKQSHLLQAYSVVSQWVHVHKNSREERQILSVQYFVFVAVIDLRMRIKVVVRSISGGAKKFHSVFPLSDISGKEAEIS